MSKVTRDGVVVLLAALFPSFPHLVIEAPADTVERIP